MVLQSQLGSPQVLAPYKLLRLKPRVKQWLPGHRLLHCKSPSAQPELDPGLVKELRKEAGLAKQPFYFLLHPQVQISSQACMTHDFGRGVGNKRSKGMSNIPLLALILYVYSYSSIILLDIFFWKPL